MQQPSRPGESPETVVPARSEEGPSRARRDHLVDRIKRINTSATQDFLNRFAESELTEYLEHLLSAQRPRGRRAVWVRRPGRPGIVTSSSDD